MRYSQEVKKFITENVQGITTKDLAILVNTKFGTAFTEDKMKNFKTNNGLKSGRKGIPAGMPSKLYPDEVKGFIKENHNGVGPKEMAAKLNEKFGTNYTHSQLKAWYGRHKLNSDITGFFPKGHVPANKGQKGICYEGSKPTHFKKGQMPHNYKPVGTERVNGDDYVDIKVADPKKWKGKHTVVWEEANGPVPKGHVVIFGDGDRRNFDLDNLILVSRAQLVRLNQNKLIQNDTELTKIGIIIADIYNKVGERQKGFKRSSRGRRRVKNVLR